MHPPRKRSFPQWEQHPQVPYRLRNPHPGGWGKTKTPRLVLSSPTFVVALHAPKWGSAGSVAEGEGGTAQGQEEQTREGAVRTPHGVSQASIPGQEASLDRTGELRVLRARPQKAVGGDKVPLQALRLGMAGPDSFPLQDVQGRSLARHQKGLCPAIHRGQNSAPNEHAFTSPNSEDGPFLL